MNNYHEINNIKLALFGVILVFELYPMRLLLLRLTISGMMSAEHLADPKDDEIELDGIKDSLISHQYSLLCF